MALKTFVQVNHITSLSDARYCAGMGVDVLSFDLDGSNQVSLGKMKEISEWIAGVDFSGRFIVSDLDKIQEIRKEMPLTFVQVSTREVLDHLANESVKTQLIHQLSSTESIALMKSVFENYMGQVDFFIVECNDQGLWKSALSELTSLAGAYPILLAFGFDQSNVLDIIDKTKVKGIVLKGSEEEQPGLKDYGEVMDILEVLEVED